jgi:hypothetical protein
MKEVMADKHTVLGGQLSTVNMGGAGRPMDDTVWGQGVVRAISRPVHTCTCIGRT